MAEGSEPPRRAPAGPGTQPCRPVPRVHTFGKGGQALRRDPHAPPAMRGWLYKQDSSGLRLWKRRWFVLVDLCLYYYRDSSEQQVRGGLPLPGYEIRILPAAPRAPRFLFTAEHPGMRTYCLGAETPEELNAWVCALRRGASPLPCSPCAPSLQMPQEPQSGGPPLPPRPCGWCPPWPPAEEVVGPPMPPTHHPPVPPLHPSKVSPRPEEAPARGEPRPMLTPPPLGRSLRELRPPEAATNQQLPPLAGGGPDAVEQDMAANQALAFPPGFSDWLLALEDSDGALPFPGTASPPAANETSPCPRAGRSGHGSEREGVAGRGAPRPIRITLLQASF